MRYVINDAHGDQILVSPMQPNGVYPRVLVRFTDVKSNQFVDMVLTDRTALDLRQAINRCIKESERIG